MTPAWVTGTLSLNRWQIPAHLDSRLKGGGHSVCSKQLSFGRISTVKRSNGSNTLVASVYPIPYDYSRHDSSVSILSFDSVRASIDDLFAYEESKCVSEKNYGSGAFPDKSLFLGLKHFHKTPRDIDIWVFPSPPPDYNLENLTRFFRLLDVLGDDSEPNLAKLVEIGKVRFVPHHLLHAAVGAFTSPFDSGYFFTLDGGGDDGDPTDFSFGEFSAKGKLTVLKRHAPSGPNITRLHDRITEFLGFDVQGNGKTDGISSYGRDIGEIADYFRKRISRDNDGFGIYSFPRSGRTPVNPSRTKIDNYSLTKILFPAPGSLDIIRDLVGYNPIDVARTGQSLFIEEVLKIVLRHLPPEGRVNCAFSGGAFNNVALNAALASYPQINAHFSMAPGDSGLSMGGALMVAKELGGGNWVSPLTGPSFSNEEVSGLIEEHSIVSKTGVTHRDVAEEIDAGKVVGIFRGRAEYGPRSLGSRSIVGDPRRQEMKARINHYVKRRDFFMPYAPAILAEHIGEYSSLGEAANPYMQVALPVRSDKRTTIPAAVHVDGSSRFQSVQREMFPDFHRLISEFYAITGVPAILNTSFNRHGISTISSPRQALEHLLSGAMDALWIEDHFVRLKDNRRVVESSISLTGDEGELVQDFVKKLRNAIHV